MSDVRLVPVSISVVFEEMEKESEVFEREYLHMSDIDEDPIGQWLKIAKARGDTSESDPVVLNLLIELHRKIDRLEQVLTNTVPTRVPLNHQERIKGIGFEHLKLSKDVLESGRRYYGRIDMPIHPKREVPLYFEALTPSLAKIIRIHEKDENEWAAYLTSVERQLIRKMKGRE